MRASVALEATSSKGRLNRSPCRLLSQSPQRPPAALSRWILDDGESVTTGKAALDTVMQTEE